MRKIKFHHSDAAERPPFTIPVRYSQLELLGSEPCLEGNVQMSRSVYKIDDSETRYKGMKASDFSLYNQLAAGVELRACRCVPSNFALVDDVVGNTVRLADYLENSSSKAS